VYLTGAYLGVQSILAVPLFFYRKEIILSKKKLEDSIVEQLGEKLLAEFEQIGESYPNFAAMFLDMVTIVSQQNTQIGKISNAMHDVVLEVNKIREVLREDEWRSRVSREIDSSSPFSALDSALAARSSRPIKKEDLN
tara:strand:- start:1824 stop:2237 length:414 start_codon:yes stop_codon:yes gene_type:complete